MPAAAFNIVEETKQVFNPCHHKKLPYTKCGVVGKIVLLRCILHENVAFVVGKIQLSSPTDHPKVTVLSIALQFQSDSEWTILGISNVTQQLELLSCRSVHLFPCISGLPGP